MALPFSKIVGLRCCLWWLPGLALVPFSGPGFAAPPAVTVTVPVQLDYALVRQVMVTQLFRDPSQTLELLNDPASCNRVVLSEPQIAPKGETLELLAKVRAQLGIGTASNCRVLLDWQGGLGLLGKPVIQPGATAIGLEPSRIWLTGANADTVSSGPLWDMASGSLKTLVGRFSLDLDPYVTSLESLLPEVLPRHSALQLQAVIDSLRLNTIEVKREGMEVAIDFEVAEAPPSLPESTLSAAELAQLDTLWQTMDALMVFAVKRYAAATDLAELRAALLDVLLDSRYRLRDVLSGENGEPAASDGAAPDRVREWFVASWQNLAPIIREIGTRQEGQEDLLWFTVLTAGDALAALDRLGPAFGLDISEDGLRRLARLVSKGQSDVLLRYSDEVDPELQRLFREQLQPVGSQPSAWRFDLSPFPRAVAAAPQDRLNQWAPGRDELPEYLPTVAQLLGASADKMLDKYPLDPEQRRLFHKMVLATAWQESCWRQYVVKSKKLEPLRSGSGDVGLMQINERVWRGIYNLQKLRWDIGYNSDAGAEVLLDYLVKYALKRAEHQRAGGLNNLARASYSAYNGGPSQVTRYRRSDVAPAWKKVDAAFWTKFQQVDIGNELKVVECLGGDFALFADPARIQASASGPGAAAAAASVPAVTVKKAPTPPSPPVSAPVPATVPGTAAAASVTAGEAWVQAQPADNYTIQVGAFSEAGSAVRFIAEQGLAAPVHVLQQRREGRLRFLVLSGSFTDRAAAAPRQQRLSHLKPWLRLFSELQTQGGF